MKITIENNYIRYYDINDKYIGTFGATGWFRGNVSLNEMFKEIYGDSLKGLIPTYNNIFKSIPK